MKCTSSSGSTWAAVRQASPDIGLFLTRDWCNPRPPPKGLDKVAMSTCSRVGTTSRTELDTTASE